MKLVADATWGKPDLLAGVEREPLVLKALDGTILLTIPTPLPRWTHEALQAAVERREVLTAIAEVGAADAFLGSQWIGSTEV